MSKTNELKGVPTFSFNGTRRPLICCFSSNMFIYIRIFLFDPAQDFELQIVWFHSKLNISDILKFGERKFYFDKKTNTIISNQNNIMLNQGDFLCKYCNRFFMCRKENLLPLMRGFISSFIASPKF